MMGGNVEALQIVMRPARDVLGATEKEANRRYIAYAPRPGFVGCDRFEVFARIRLAHGDRAWTTLLHDCVMP
jgi:hypothetical protein